MMAMLLGRRLSDSSSTQGRPHIISSADAIPPVWKVRMGQLMPGSPMDSAAITHRLAQTNRLAVGHIGAVAACADTGLCTAGQQAADLQAGDAGCLDLVGIVQVDHLALGHDDLAGDGVDHIAHVKTADQTLAEALDLLLALVDLRDPQAIGSAAVDLADDDVAETSTMRRVGPTRSAVRRAVSARPTSTAGETKYSRIFRPSRLVCTNGHLDGVTGGVCQQAAHTSQLRPIWFIEPRA